MGVTIADDYTDAPGPVVVTLADVAPESVSWLWPARLPAGKIVILDGDPAVGKSTLAVDWAARLSTGTPWPDGSSCPLGDVLVLSAEDGLADTIRPRLDAAGGDPRRVHSLTGATVRDDDGDLRERPVTLADAGVMAAAVQHHSVRLLVVDVMMAYLPTGTDSHRDQDIRTVLARVARVAEDHSCCVLLLRHLNKSAGGNPLYRGGGSIGIIGAARAGFVAAVDPDDETGRVVACTKSNLAPMPPTLAYRLESAGNGTARVDWLGPSTATAATLLARDVDNEERSERDEAAEWLVGYLEANGGEVRASDAIRAARRDGIAERTLKRARGRSGIVPERRGFGEGSVWSSPIGATFGPSRPAPLTLLERPECGPNECPACTSPLEAEATDCVQGDLHAADQSGWLP